MAKEPEFVHFDSATVRGALEAPLVVRVSYVQAIHQRGTHETLLVMQSQSFIISLAFEEVRQKLGWA